MTTCKHCGWEVRQDFGAWVDAWEHAVCWWQGDTAMPHEPLREKVKTARPKTYAA
jgi:hypothetical protein